MHKAAIITGASGQDSSYLGELLLSKDYKVYGIARRVSVDTNERIQHLLTDPNYEVIEGDITDSGCMHNIINKLQVHELYNLAAMSHVGTSFQQCNYSIDVNLKGVANILEGIRLFSPHTKVYQASTSEMFGNNFSLGEFYRDKEGHKLQDKFQDENTPFNPCSPYAVAKMGAHYLCSTYRKAYKLYIACGILFNHESRRRGDTFVTRKISKWLGSYRKWRADYSYFPINFDEEMIYVENTSKYLKLRLGALSSYRDWSHAKDMVRGMWLMLQQEQPDDYVLASGHTHSVQDFLREAFAYVGIDDFEPYVFIDNSLYRANEVDYLCGDATKANKQLGWYPEVTFKELVKDMVEGDRYGSKEKKELV